MSGSNKYEGGAGTLQQVVALGTSTVTTQTNVVGSIPKDCRVTAVRYYGQSAVTATGLTAECFVRTTAGATGASLQSAATDIAFGSAAAGLAGVDASLTTTYEDRYPEKDQCVEVTFSADTCTAGPGDLLVTLEYEPR